MKIVEVNALLTAVRECQGLFSKNPTSMRFSFMLAKNVGALSKEVTLAQETITAGMDLALLRSREARRRDLSRERALLDDEGAPVMVAGEYRLATFEDLRWITEKLDEEFPGTAETLSLVATRESEVGVLEVVVNLTKLPLEAWPDLPAPLVERMMPLIEE